MTTTINTTTPDSFSIQADSYDRENFPGLRKGPAAGGVETTWTPDEGFLVYVGDSEGMTVDEATKLAADLRGVLERVAGL